MSEVIPAPSQESLERQALAALRGLRKKMDDLEASRREGIAIIGLACNFPGAANDADSYWQLLREQRCAIGEIPSSRMELDAIFSADPDAPGKTYSRWAGLLEHADAFDANFFGISPREASQTDPQQRIFLECVWHALEDAGISPASLAGSPASVFVGATTHEYSSLQTRSVAAHEIDRYSALGAALNAIAGRVSHVLGLHGPSLCIDTACSSSLVAVDRACRSLRDGECDLAIAGGVNILAFDESLIAASRWGMLSSTGRVRAFGLGDGFVRGEGCGVVVLKRLSAARRAGDRILGVILGSSVNHDGPGSGLTVPNGRAQAMLLRAALASAGLAPSAVGYVEAHGTGTRLGDPIEAEALGEVFAGPSHAPRDAPLKIGSVKTNLGHLEAAAGIAGLIKLVLSLNHAEIPAQLQDGPLSEHVRWSELPLEVATRHQPWHPIAGRRIGGVSAFGFSGTNAHVIVEEAPRQQPEQQMGQEPEVEVLVLSAKSITALDRMVERTIAHLASHPEQPWNDVCHTAAVGRTHFKHRIAVVAATMNEGLALLRGYARKQPSPEIEPGQIEKETRPRTNLLLRNEAVPDPPSSTKPATRLDHALALAEAYVAGNEVDWAAKWAAKWAAQHDGRACRRIALPGYPFERQRHWFTPSAQPPAHINTGPTSRTTGHPLLGRELRLAGEGRRYEQLLRIDTRLAPDATRDSETQVPLNSGLAWLREHRIQGRALMPATALLEIMLAAGDRIPGGGGEPLLDDVVFSAPMPLDSSRLMQVAVDAESLNQAPGAATRSRVRIYSAASTDTDEPNPSWTLHAEGYVHRSTNYGAGHTAIPAEAHSEAHSDPFDDLRNRCSEVIEAKAFYALMLARGADFGPRFQRIERIWHRPGEALGQVLSETLGEVRIEHLGTRLHPASFDACLQVAAAAILLHDTSANEDTSGETRTQSGSEPRTQSGSETPSQSGSETRTQSGSETRTQSGSHTTPALLPFQVTQLRLLLSPVPCDTCFVHAKHLPSPNPKHTTFQITLLAPTPHHPHIATLNLTFAKQISTNTVANLVYETEWVPIAPRDNEDLASCSGCWLILADRGGIGKSLEHEITTLNGECFLVSPADEYRQQDERRFTARLTNRKDFADVLRSLPRTAAKLRIVHLWSLDAHPYQGIDARELLASQQLGYGACLALVQAVVESGLECSLFLVTQSVKPTVSAKSTTSGPALWAMRRAIRVEHPEIFMKAIDLAGEPGEIPASRLLSELRSTAEPETALDLGKTFVPRLVLQPSQPFLEDNTAIALKLGRAGILDDLHHESVERIEPAGHEVEIEIHAAGLNFRDVLNALGMIPVADAELGGECAGTIVRAGRATRFNPGDEVLAFAPGLLRSHVTLNASSVFPKPAGLNFIQAATLPVVYFTAIFALCRLAHLQRGETVLIHAGAGGLGQAAVAVATMLGARIVATAGSEEKRQYLRAQGVELVMDSRSLAFGNQILHATEGRGVDVILNSLSGDFIDESLRVLAHNGRFLEAGKRSVLAQEEVSQRRPDANYFLFDLGTEAAKQPGLIPSLMGELTSHLENGVLAPLPVHPFSSTEVASAFRTMAQARHIGKLAIFYDHPWRLHPAPATYLVTGGLGSLGLHAAAWLLRRGARSLILVSRHPHPESNPALTRLQETGASIRVVYADCARLDGVRTALKAIPAQAPLRGVVHCAGVLRDGTLMNQTWNSFHEVAEAKLCGAWNLHIATEARLLDFFIAFSSASSILGSAGQANYAAANAAMDALMQLRRSYGLPALSINWGPWQGEGMAAKAETNLRHPGLRKIEAWSAFKTVEDLLRRQTTQAIVLPSGHGTAWLSPQEQAGDDPFLAALSDAAAPNHSRGQVPRATLAPSSPEMTRSRLIACIQDDFAKVSGGTTPLRFTEETSFADAGLDSLMAVELRNALMKSLDRNLPATVALDYPTVGELADFLLPRKPTPSASALRRPHLDATHPADTSFEALSEEEAEALLLDEIDRGTA